MRLKQNTITLRDAGVGMSDVRYSGRETVPDGGKGVELKTTSRISRSKKKELTRALKTQESVSRKRYASGCV